MRNHFVYIILFIGFSLNLKAACPNPALLSSFLTTANSTNITWVQGSNDESWVIEYGISGFSQGNGTILNLTNDTTTLNGLLSNTTYDVYLRSVCIIGDSSDWIGPTEVITKCVGSIQAPWSDGVEGHSYTTNANINDCWSTTPYNNYSSYRWNVSFGSTPSGNTGPSIANNGNNYFFTEASSGNLDDTAQLYTPLIDISFLSAPGLSFYYHMFGSSMGSLVVDVFDGTNWNDSLVVLTGQQQSSGSSPWIEQFVDLSAYSGVIQVRFKAFRGSDFDGDISIDDIKVFNVPTCYEPTNLSAFEVAKDSANITWLQGQNNSSWILEYGDTGFVQGLGTIINSLNDSVTINGLLPSTMYDVYLRSVCSVGDSSIWIGPLQFTTNCSPSVIAPWIDDVEMHQLTTTSNILNCWSSTPSNVTNIYSWNVGAGGIHSSNTGPYGANSGENYFYIESTFGSSGDLAELYSPLIDLDTLTNPGLSFYYHIKGVGAVGSLIVDVFNGTTWDDSLFVISGQQQPSINSPWIEQWVDLSAYSGTIQLRFSSYRAGKWADISIDDIKVENLPTCYDPTDLSVYNIGMDSVNITWLSHSADSAFVLEYGLIGFTKGTGTIVNSVNDTVSVNGLIPSTKYHVYVKSICGFGDSSRWVGPISFATDCSPIVEAPWLDDLEFQNVQSAPGNCWFATGNFQWQSRIGRTPNSNNNQATGPLGAYSGQKYFYTEASNRPIGSVGRLYSPMIDVNNLSIPALSFYYHMYGYGMGTLIVDVFDGTSWNDSVFVISGQQQTTQSADWIQQWVDLSAYSDTIQIRFTAHNGSNWRGDMSIDYIEINELPCIGANSLATFNVGQDSTDITWLNSGSDSIWILEYGPTGFQPGTGTFINTTIDTLTINGLTPGTTYDVYIRSICGLGDSSVLKGPLSFSTLCSGQMAGNYTINKTSPISATNYHTFNGVSHDLSLCGISGPVVIRVKGGVYNEQVTLGNISGSSSINTITFKPALSDVSIAKLTYSLQTSSTNWTLRFDSASYIIFDSLKIESQSVGYGRVVSFGYNNNNITFRNNELKGKMNAQSFSGFYIFYNEDGSHRVSSHLTFDNNLTIGGSAVFYMPGPFVNGIIEDSLIIINNRFVDYSSMGVRLDRQHNILIENNNFESNGGTGIAIEDCYAPKIKANKIKLNGASINTGISFEEVKGVIGNPAEIINNMIITSENSNPASSSYGIRIKESDSVNVFHNTVNVQGSSLTFGRSLGMGIYAASPNTNLDIRNNVFVNSGGGYALEIGAADSLQFISSMNNNLFYSAGSIPFKIHDTTYTNLPDWKLNTGLDLNSVYGDPIFTSPTDLHLEGNLANDEGDNTLGVTIDIDGDVRPLSPSTTVDIGADEFNPLFCSRPVDFRVYDAGYDSVLVSWTSGLNDSVWKLEYGPKGYVQGTGTLLTLTSNPSIVYGLSPDTEYDFYLRTICNTNDSSVWVGPVTDTTLVLCARPVSVSATESGINYVNLSWNAAPGNISYVLEYGLKDFVLGTGTTLATSLNIIQVNGLMSSTEYDFYVRSVCVSGDSSLWEGSFLGRTKCDAIIIPPYTNNFDILTPVSSPSACSTTEYMTECFTNDLVNNQSNWIPFKDSTPSSYTGPKSDRTAGSGNYIYLESGGCYNSINTLNTPYFDLTGLTDPKLDFSYHMYGGAIGNLRLVAYTQSGTSYTQFTKTGNQGDMWHDTTLSLIEFEDSTIRFEFVGQIGPYFTSDIAIDDFKIYEEGTPGIIKNEVASQFIVFPNPNNGRFKILNKGNNVSSIISIIDVQGRIVYAKSINLKKSKPEEIYLSNLTKGLYIVQIETKGLTIQNKIIIN